MVLIEWRDEYCTGISGVDYEHEQLIDEINSVYAMIKGQADKQAVVDSLGDIYGHISAHFALEEQIMCLHGYPYYEQHKADHERLLDEIREITEDYERTVNLDQSAFQQKLADWFQLHFKTHDSRLHRLVEMPPHQEESESSINSLVESTKNKFLRRLRR
ncbi:MAG: hemerythrin family protein [Gammaproteobacteria bacterium]|nr:hemerythrin family protein [Gammaproteobacteria bacterium]